jgi:SAM-dependent methyltransferase
MLDTTQLHANQVEYWNGLGASRWIAQQARRDAMLGDFAKMALVRAGAQPGERVIDIGCGCGETSVELARQVGPAGEVVAADVSAPLIAQAQERLADFPWAKAQLVDAATYPFEPGAADLLFSRFGVMFFGDPPTAFTNLRRALKPGGRMVFACWRDPAENPWMNGSLGAVSRHLPPPTNVDPEQPGPFAFARSETVADIMTRAGFSPPAFEKLNATIDVAQGQGLDGAVASAMEFGMTAGALEGQPESVLAAAKGSLHEHFAPLVAEGAVNLQAAIWIVSASASGT